MPDGRTGAPSPREILEHLPLGLCLVDGAGRIVYVNPSGRRLVGDPDDVMGRDLVELFPLERVLLRESLLVSLSEGLPAHLVAVPFASAGKGRDRVLDVTVTPYGPDRRPDGAVVVISDVTDRVRELERARLFYQSFLHSHEAMEVTDRAGILVDVNPAFERIYGYSRAEVVGQKPRVVRSPKTPSAIYAGLWKDILDPRVGRWSGEIINLDRNGREHPVQLTINALRDEGGEITHFIGVATDLSEQKAFELQVARADRLASVGQLAAGVAHELNTPLANIMLIAESLKRRAPNPWVSGRAEAITSQVDAAARIVSGLLDFSRHHPPRTADVDLAAIVREAISFSKGKQSPDVEILETLDPEPLWVRGERVQLLQVFVNLVNNAFDAMEGRGSLTVRSGRDDSAVWISVQDTGSGIPPSVLPHIFEPFFTTKTDGRGTGLGLSIVHGIVRAHGGSVTVDTEVGRGTTFTVRLPAKPTDAPAPSAAVD